MRIDVYTKDIAAAATIENLVADAGGKQYKFARAIILRCPSGNSGPMLIGSKDRRGMSIAANTERTLQEINVAGSGGKYELEHIFVQAAGDGDDVEILLIDPS